MIDIHGGLPQQPVGTAGTQPTNDSPYSPGDGQEDECAKGNGVLQHQQGRNKLHLGKFCDFCWQFLTLWKTKKNKYRCCPNNLGNSGRKDRCRLRHYVLKKTFKTCCRLNQFYRLWWTRAMKMLGNNDSIYRSQWLLVGESHILGTFGLFNLIYINLQYIIYIYILCIG